EIRATLPRHVEQFAPSYRFPNQFQWTCRAGRELVDNPPGQLDVEPSVFSLVVQPFECALNFRIGDVNPDLPGGLDAVIRAVVLRNFARNAPTADRPPLLAFDGADPPKAGRIDARHIFVVAVRVSVEARVGAEACIVRA